MANRPLSNRRNLSPSRILDTVFAFRHARVLLTAFELDVFTSLGDNEKTSAEIADVLRTNERATDRLMNALVAAGFLKKKNGRFANTPLSARFLVKGKPEYLAGLGHSVSLWKTWGTLTDAVRKGSTVGVRETASESRRIWLEAFIAAMHMRAVRQAPVVIKLLDLKGVKCVLDVGGGSGAFSMAFAGKGIRAVVFDLPNVTRLTHNYVEAEHLGNLITTTDGDYRFDSFGSGFDLVFLSAIIHSNSVETNKELFKKASDALNTNGQLVVVDFIMNEERTSPAAGAFFALNMLVGTQEGDTYTESEVRSWMEEAGFKSIWKRGTPFDTTLMVGKKRA